MDFKCNWAKECPLSGLCKRVAEETDEVRQKWITPTRMGQDCPWFIPAEDERKEQR